MVGTSLKYNDPARQLKKRIAEYESVLAKLENSYQDKAINDAATAAKRSWKPIKQALMTALVSTDRETMRKQAQFLHHNVHTLIEKFMSLKKHLLSAGKIEHPREMDAVLDIAFASRQLSSQYLLMMWKIPDNTLMQDWTKGVAAHRKSLKLLEESYLGDNPKFQSSIKRIKKAVKYLVMGMTFASEETFMPSLFHKKCNIIFREANSMANQIANK